MIRQVRWGLYKIILVVNVTTIRLSVIIWPKMMEMMMIGLLMTSILMSISSVKRYEVSWMVRTKV